MGSLDRESKKGKKGTGPFSEGYKPSKGKRMKSQFHEKHTAEIFHGRTTPGSGAKPFHKGDVKSDHFMVECKLTDNKSMTFKTEWLKKIYLEAFTRNRFPAVHLQFNDIVDDVVEKNWVMIPESVMKMILDGSSDNSN